jgi:hypothetical protein
MSDAGFQAEVEQLCADLDASLAEIAAMLDGLNPARRHAELTQRRAAIVNALHAMNPAQGSAAFAKFPELRLLENLPVEQLQNIMKSWGHE